MIVVDSSVWIDYFNGTETRETNRLDTFLGHEPIMIGDLILTEVLQGFRRDSDYQTAKTALETLIFAPMIGHDIAIASAENYRSLRAKGLTVRKTIDVLIATFCIENTHQLLHSDRDFDIMEKHLGLITV
ncbi:type II toxin-antitoxin system VapC family toxin [Hellea balneolensis]|uniref:type II toxin-antitoxin system VapC family toxin n=1 Tax=Hellea balneolensis TaxID=287478 RepID=UPI0004087239|nr:PIN domain nuclease [Hellea balneolensis]